MTLPAEIDIDDVFKIYIFSNTPSYLYRKLRVSSTVKWAARNLSVAQVLDIYGQTRQARGSSGHALAVAYAMLVALSLMDYSEVKPAVEGLETEGLEWGAIILRKIVAPLIVSQYSEVQLLSPVRRGRQGVSSSASTLGVIRLGHSEEGR